MPSTDNSRLEDCLQAAGWKPRDLARAVNERLERRGDGARRIHPTAPYAWLKRGYCPYPPTAQTVAEVLSDRLARRITVGALWPSRAEADRPPMSAGDSLDPVWTLNAAVTQLTDLASAGDAELKAIRPVSSQALVRTALSSADHAPPPIQSFVGGERVLPPMMDLIGDHIASLRRLDDRQGGGALSVRYVTGELTTLLDLIKRAGYSRDIGLRLHSAAANLAQLAGWMYYDAGAIGASQRYFFLGMRIAGSDQKATSTANILGMLAYLAAENRQVEESLRLAEAADAAAARASAAMRARAAGRLATAYAAAGDLDAFRRSAGRARTLLEKRRFEDDPPSLYYLSPDQLDAEAGHGLLGIAAAQPARANQLLDEAIALLTPLASAGPEADYQRSALLHGTYLAQAQLQRGDLEAACRTGRTAISRLPVVQSRRCRLLLAQFGRAVAPRRRNPMAAEFVRDLQRAMAPQ